MTTWSTATLSTGDDAPSGSEAKEGDGAASKSANVVASTTKESSQKLAFKRASELRTESGLLLTSDGSVRGIAGKVNTKVKVLENQLALGGVAL